MCPAEHEWTQQIPVAKHIIFMRKIQTDLHVYNLSY